MTERFVVARDSGDEVDIEDIAYITDDLVDAQRYRAESNWGDPMRVFRLVEESA